MALKDRADLAPVLFDRFTAELRRGFASLGFFDRFAAELRRGFAPLGFFHAVDWKEPWLIGLLTFHVVLLLITIISRRNLNFQLPLSFLSLSGVSFAETINCFLAKHWKSFAGQNYFDTRGRFISALWSSPLLFIADIVLVNILFILHELIVKWKKAELKRRARRRARVSRGKQD